MRSRRLPLGKSETFYCVLGVYLESSTLMKDNSDVGVTDDKGRDDGDVDGRSKEWQHCHRLVTCTTCRNWRRRRVNDGCICGHRFFGETNSCFLQDCRDRDESGWQRRYITDGQSSCFCGCDEDFINRTCGDCRVRTTF